MEQKPFVPKICAWPHRVAYSPILFRLVGACAGPGHISPRIHFAARRLARVLRFFICFSDGTAKKTRRAPCLIRALGGCRKLTLLIPPGFPRFIFRSCTGKKRDMPSCVGGGGGFALEVFTTPQVFTRCRKHLHNTGCICHCFEVSSFAEVRTVWRALFEAILLRRN